jgi:hypothetical protein
MKTFLVKNVFMTSQRLKLSNHRPHNIGQHIDIELLFNLKMS